jgi:cyclic beta-1,2-glucan synthetase
VLGFYRSEEHAEEALRQARKNHVQRSAAVHRTASGQLKIAYAGLGPLQRAFFGLAVASLATLLAQVFAPPLWLLALSAAAGFLLAWFGTTWSGLGIPRKVLVHYGRFLFPGESLVAAQQTEERTPAVIALWRQTAPVAVFTIRPRLRCTSPPVVVRPPREPVTLATLSGLAAGFAATHTVDPSLRARPLFPLVEACESTLECARADLAEAARLDYGITHAAEWLLDNAYLLRSHIADIRHDLPANHHRILPLLQDQSGPARFRVYQLATELIQLTGHRPTAETIQIFLDGYQTHTPLNIVELWVFPLFLRLVLLETVRRLAERTSLRQHQKELADFWANRLLNAVQRSPEQFDRIVARLDRDGDELTSHFLARFSEQLHKEESLLLPIQKWIEAKTGRPLADIVYSEHAEEANDLMLIGDAIGSLRQLSELQYPKIVEAVSRMETILRQDPAGIHPRSDFSTRDRCRRTVEAIARHSSTSELEVARQVVEVANHATSQTLDGCIAYHLLDDGQPALERRLGCRVPWRERQLRFFYRHPTLLYLGGLALLTAALGAAFLFAAHAAGASLLALILLGLLALIPASELATFLLHTTVAWALPPRVLPKMSFKEGIPDDCCTLVVIPMMLLTPDSIRHEIEKLEVRYLANPCANLHFALLADFTDAEDREMPEDDALLGLVIQGIEKLNASYPGAPFLLFHRTRVWCESENRWIGWERKRGKLEELNAFLCGSASGILVSAGAAPAGVRYIITLDADTQLPHGRAAKLIETIAHPLNRIELSPDRRRRTRGFAIIQPRVSITLPSANATRFSRLFSDARGSDPYCQAVSDVYQDLFGEAIYHGKAIYDVQAFHQLLHRRFPEQRLLSHDLIEGAYVGIALATDIELFEQFPYDYAGFSKRQHRWIRGDWQIASWILPRVPTQEPAVREANPLSLINRWKILDNLRRSLLPGAALLLLLCSWLSGAAPLPASALVAGVLLVPLCVQLCSRLLQRFQGDTRSLREANSDLNRALVMAAFLPHQAYLAADAASRACYRLTVSHRHLLEWQTAELSNLAAAAHLDSFRAQFFTISAAAATLLFALSLRSAPGPPPWLPFLLLWVAAPAVLHWIGSPRRFLKRLEQVDDADQRYLRRVARETWRFFDDLVGPDSNWLPPDNTQQALRVEVADRTSPTNIGMGLMAAVSARDLGYLTPTQFVHRCSATFGTLEKLETCEGHILNWYNTKTLEPLNPRYVSTVDSGNLLACLWVLTQTTEELDTQPQLDAAALRGLADTLSIITFRFPAESDTGVFRDTLQTLFQETTSGYEISERIRLAAEPARKLTESLRWSASDATERVYWFRRLEQQLQAWIDHLDHYLGWTELLFAPPDDFLAPLGNEVLQARRRLRVRLPSWGEVARGEVSALQEILRGHPPESVLPPKLTAWILDLNTLYEAAKVAAADLLAQAATLGHRSEALASGMNMRFLYDADRSLLSIGYQVGGPVTFNAHYDLLASEARLSSFVAIAKGDLPMRHWFSLGRPYTTSSGQVLLSWSGTMFEYLMPMLFTLSFRNSLLDNACSAAVERQIQYAAERDVPWGISESAHSAIDTHKIYQYRAFGVPSLGLKRGLEEDLVVAPYATALALLIDPAKAIENLKRLEKLGMYGDKGFYESLDFTRQPERDGDRGVIVYCYMAHHQGMSLMAINNVLHHGIMRQRFHADRRIQAVEPLLFERIPSHPSLLVHRPSDQTAIRPISEPEPPAYQLLDEDTPIPRCHLLGNARYSLMITNSGAGYSRWGKFELTRWRADTTRDPWGMFFYLRDEASGQTWSATHQPLNQKDPRYTAVFNADRAEFRRRNLGIESHVEVTVSPDDDVEIRRVTLVNHGARIRQLDLTSAVELSLAPHDADRAHPAFNKLFIETEALPHLQALLAWRRLRSLSEEPVFVAQLVTESHPSAGPFEFETDRAHALGRNRSWQQPALALRQSQGYVLDPVFVIRRRFALEPRQQRQITYVTLAAASREELLRLIVKYRDRDFCHRTFELAWSHAQLQYRYLGIRSDEAFRFTELASHLLYPNATLRAPAERLRRNTLGQSRLWAYGISGDLPLLAVLAADSQGLSLVRELLVAHTYWRLHGFKADLVILNREPASYDQPLHQQLLRLAEAHSLHTGLDQPGGVFLRKSDQIPEPDLNLLLCVAQATLGIVRGPLARQLAVPTEANLYPPLLPLRAIEEQPSPPLPFLELPYFNGLGGFTAGGREYAIYLGPGVSTPLPWINVMANSAFGALVSESGAGCTWYANSQSNRLTPWNNDPVADPSADVLYIRDEDSGAYWTPTPSPVRELDAYRIRHGQGYSECEHNSHALEQSLLTFVPVQAHAADPIRIQSLRIRNRSRGRRRLSITAYSELVLGADREATQMHLVTSWDEAAKTLYARNPYHPSYGHRVTFAALEPAAVSHTADRTEFLGRNGSVRAPAALRRFALARRTGAGLDPCAALQTRIDLAPGEEKTIFFLLGQADDETHARELVQRYRQPAQADAALHQTRQRWDDLLGTIQVETPILSVNFLMNRWLLYQSLSCRIWGRSALYQSSGAYGFRDQLQDSLAIVYTAPDITREMILRAASRQFLEGDVQHWWHMPSGEGIRSRCSDDLLWLPYAVCQYLSVTGDAAILDESAPFLEAPVLKPDEHEIYNHPQVSPETATIFEHCRRAIEKGSTQGPHGLPLIGTGDWNDGMNTVGPEGKGESVWLAWFLIDVLNKFAPLCDARGHRQLAFDYRERARLLAETVEATSWDGAWYRRGYFDDGTPLGSHDRPEASTDSLAQSWSVISGAGNPERSRQGMAAVDQHLVRRADRLVLLLTPPFNTSRPHPGYIMGYPPGVRENGGQYTHAALWVAMAYARLGDGARAVEILDLLNPVEHARTPQDCQTYRTEPYAVAADVYSLAGQVGRGGWTWYTGSAGWMYRIWLEEVLGFQLQGDQLTMRPAIPPDWPGFVLTFRYHTTTYRIEVSNGGERSTQPVTLHDDGGHHTLHFQAG